MLKRVALFTDGACRGNPGPGGWGSIVVEGKVLVAELGGSEKTTTNNRMELMAAVKGLEHAAKGSNVIIYTDSSYLINGITKWIHGWKKNGWRTSDKKPVKNLELWQALDLAVARHVIDWRWVKGHNGDAMNERADELANEGMAPFKPKKRKAAEMMPPM